MQTLTVSQLNSYIKLLLDGDKHLASLSVRGEISGWTRQSSGHCYFTLKDRESQLRCVLFAGNTRNLKFLPENGMSVIAFGRISVYTVSGQYQFYVEDIQPDGFGSLALQFEQTKKKLESEGLFDPSRKRPLPPFPKTVGVITSPTGAAIHDIIRTLRERSPQTKILLFPARVQGAEAEADLIFGLKFFSVTKCCDVVLFGRGGGSVEDLWVFNHEAVARAVANCQVPVISCVGHESDFCICDFCSDARAATPTMGAMMSAPDNSELQQTLDTLDENIEQSVQNLLKTYSAQLESMEKSWKKPTAMLTPYREQIIKTAEKLNRALEKDLTRHENNLTKTAVRLESLSPLSVLKRGYTAVSKNDGTPVHSVSEVKENETVNLTLCDGALSCKVVERIENGK